LNPAVHPAARRGIRFGVRLAAVIAVALPGIVPLAAQDSTVAPRRSWTSDRLRVQVGDVVTVLIDERTLASAGLRDHDVDRRGRDMGVQANLPGGTSMGGSLSSGQDNDARRTGESVRQNNFRSEVSARVVAVSPTGMLQLEGEKELLVDRAVQKVTVTGWVRPNDIAVATNTVESWRMADARIAYAQSGDLGKPRSGIITRILGKIWP
jgi:flagellar L-ring protein precursor FlgH